MRQAWGVVLMRKLLLASALLAGCVVNQPEPQPIQVFGVYYDAPTELSHELLELPQPCDFCDGTCARLHCH